METTETIQNSRWFINHKFSLLWIGRTISITGDFFFNTTMILWFTTNIARGQSWAPLAISGVALAEIIPTLVVGPIAGVFVDRWDKRRTMLLMDVLRTVLIALLLLTTGLVVLVLGPTLAAPLYFAFGAQWAILIDALSLSGYGLHSCGYDFYGCGNTGPVCRSICAVGDAWCENRTNK